MSALVVNGPIPRSPRPPASRAAIFVGHVSGIVGLTLVLTTAGAFDSDEFATSRSLTMFSLVSALLIGQSSLLAGWTLRRCSSRIAGALLTACGTLAVMTAEIHLLKLAGILPYPLDPLHELAVFIAPLVLAITAVVFATKMLSWEAVETTPPPKSRSMAGQRADGASDWRFHFPPTEQVRRVQSHDHYLLVWTSERRIMIRGRMVDALRRLSHRDGISPHRSWWVARSDIHCIQRQGRDVVLRLCDGGQVPVARGRVQGVKQWLDGHVGTAAHSQPSGPSARSGFLCGPLRRTE